MRMLVTVSHSVTPENPEWIADDARGFVKSLT